MLFTSYSFLGFAAAVIVLYYLMSVVKSKNLQWPLLLVASYVFYAFSGLGNLFYIAFTTVSTYILTRAIENIGIKQSEYLKTHKEELDREAKKIYKGKQKKKQWRLLLLCLFLNIGMLAVIKYTNFVIYNINEVKGWFGDNNLISFWDIALPMGISFYVFQTMGYAIDVYRGKYPAERNFFKLALFTSFFPQLIQGPISRFDDLSKTLYERHSFNTKTISMGLQRVLWGFFKKLVIADRMLVGVNALISDPDTYTGAFAFVGMLFYALELYADFTGGIDITIGIAEALGIKVTENFHRPYFSKNIKEYWNRWHITMGSWFTDYIFYPISVCGPMLKFSKWTRKHLGEKVGKKVPVWSSCFVVWFATGIWHGASWNFIVWGLMNCLVILVSDEFTTFYRWFHSKFNVDGKLWFKMFRVTRTVLLLSSLRMFDCYRDVPLTFKMFGTMFTEMNYGALFNGSLMNIGLTMEDYIILLVSTILLFTVSMIQRSGLVREKIASLVYPIRFAIWFGLFVAVILLGTYGIGYNASQFIYNQF